MWPLKRHVIIFTSYGRAFSEDRARAIEKRRAWRRVVVAKKLRLAYLVDTVACLDARELRVFHFAMGYEVRDRPQFQAELSDAVLVRDRLRVRLEVRLELLDARVQRFAVHVVEVLDVVPDVPEVVKVAGLELLLSLLRLGVLDRLVLDLGLAQLLARAAVLRVHLLDDAAVHEEVHDVRSRERLEAVRDLHEREAEPLLLLRDVLGDELRVDKSVGDIYGDDGCADLGMPAALTAANFGRLASLPPGQRPRPEDLVRAVLKMVVQASVVVVKAFAEGQREGLKEAGDNCAPTSEGEDLLQRVFFVGGFVGAEENTLARQLIARSMAAVGGRALFCRRAEFLGALGSLADCVRRHETSEV